MNFDSALSGIGISAGSTQDFLLLVVVLVLSLLAGLTIARRRLVGAVVSTYIAWVVVLAVPDDTFKDYIFKMIAFVAIFVALNYFGNRFYGATITGAKFSFMWRSILGSFLEIAMLVSILVQLLPEKAALQYVSASALGYLTADWWRLAWMAAPALFLVIINKDLN